MKRIAVISVILEQPAKVQSKFNNIVSEFSDIILGRMGIPVRENDISAICITVAAELDIINNLTGRLGKLDNVTVKTAVSKKEIA